MANIMGAGSCRAAEEEEHEILRMVATAKEWAAGVGGVKNSDYQMHIDSGHVLPLTDGMTCDACIKNH